jgi:hypothetical protein
MKYNSMPSVVALEKDKGAISLVGKKLEIGESQNLNLKFEEVIKSVIMKEKSKKKVTYYNA